jgi:hypothetical protein
MVGAAIGSQQVLYEPFFAGGPIRHIATWPCAL